MVAPQTSGTQALALPLLYFRTWLLSQRHLLIQRWPLILQFSSEKLEAERRKEGRERGLPLSGVSSFKLNLLEI